MNAIDRDDTAQKIAEIREALEKATQGLWKWVDVYKKNDFEKYNMGGFVNEEGKLICHFGNRIDYYPTEGEPPDYYDELLIANAPEWLRFLLSELDREREENRKLRERLKEELVWQDECLNMEEQLQSAQQDRDKLIKVLQWYADEDNWRSSRFVLGRAEADGGERAQAILDEIGVTVE